MGDHRRRIRATDAAKNFGKLIDEVRESGAGWIVERGGVPVAQVSPLTRAWTVREFAEWAGNRRGDAAFERAVEAGRAAANRPAAPKDPWES
ncbi:MAG TPA: hypothetical protein VFV98_13275 [Vicinamibacterales bacterium]|nr:hypothetical protein [Vicinamibacterales bacterium]